MFEEIIRRKARFHGLGIAGMPTIEDLYDLNKRQLADMEVRQIEVVEKLGKGNRFDKKSDKLEIEELKLKAISHIIDTKIKEDDESANAQAKKARKAEILGLIAAKEKESLAAKSMEELQKELEML